MRRRIIMVFVECCCLVGIDIMMLSILLVLISDWSFEIFVVIIIMFVVCCCLIVIGIMMLSILVLVIVSIVFVYFMIRVLVVCIWLFIMNDLCIDFKCCFFEFLWVILVM